MGVADRIAQVDAAIAAQRAVVNEELARLRGLEVEREALRSGVAIEGGLLEMSRTDALLTILRRAPGTMSPKELLQTLEKASRSDDLRSVTATLNYLLKAGSVQRPSRGRYLAV